MTTRRPRSVRDPFKYETKIAKFAKHLFLFCFYLAGVSLSAYWIIQARMERRAILKCSLRRHWLFYIATIAAQYVFSMALRVASLKRFKKVFTLNRPLFSTFERPVEGPDGAFETILYKKGHLHDTVQSIRQVLRQVKKEQKTLFSATHFLLSSDGRALLTDICKGLAKFRLLDGKLVRMAYFKFWVFFVATGVCALLSLAGAYSEAGNCKSRVVFLMFLQYLSVTLLTVISVAAFSGISTHDKLFCISTERMPVTEDEKFLISLLAANSDGMFSGLSRNRYSGYANIQNEGTADVFVPMHMSLFAYKEARTNGKGHMRDFNERADDCVGNYEMGGISPIVIV